MNHCCSSLISVLLLVAPAHAQVRGELEMESQVESPATSEHAMSATPREASTQEALGDEGLDDESSEEVSELGASPSEEEVPAESALEARAAVPLQDEGPVRTHLLSQEAAFCRPDYRLEQDERTWCDAQVASSMPVASHAAPLCPELANHCARAAKVVDISALEWLLTQTASFLKWLARARWFLAAILVALLTMVVVWFARRSVRSAATDDESKEHSPSSATTQHLLELETDVERLLQRAQDAEKIGQTREAIALVYAAIVRALEHARWVTVAKNHTARDYLRQMRRQGGVSTDAQDMQRTIAKLFNDMERLQFGDDSGHDAAEPWPVVWRGLVEQTHRVVAFLRRAVLPSVLLCLALASAACVTPPDQRLTGRALLWKALHERGVDASAFSFSTAHSRPSPVGNLLVLEDALLGDDEWAYLGETAAASGLVFVVVGDLPVPPWLRANVREATTLEPINCSFLGTPAFASLVDGAGTPASAPVDAATFPCNQLHVRAHAVFAPEEGWTPILSSPSGHYAMARVYGRGLLVRVADGALFENGQLLFGDNLLALAALVGGRYARVEYLDALTGRAAAHPYAAVAFGRASLLALHLLVAYALLVWALGIRLGAGRDRRDETRRAFSSHVHAVGVLYARAGDRVSAERLCQEYDDYKRQTQPHAAAMHRAPRPNGDGEKR